jgi:hypothetical protein
MDFHERIYYFLLLWYDNRSKRRKAKCIILHRQNLNDVSKRDEEDL